VIGDWLYEHFEAYVPDPDRGRPDTAHDAVLVGFSFNASLEPQLRARRRARLAEDAPARNAFWTGRVRPDPGTACAA